MKRRERGTSGPRSRSSSRDSDLRLTPMTLAAFAAFAPHVGSIGVFGMGLGVTFAPISSLYSSLCLSRVSHFCRRCIPHLQAHAARSSLTSTQGRTPGNSTSVYPAGLRPLAHPMHFKLDRFGVLGMGRCVGISLRSSSDPLSPLSSFARRCKRRVSDLQAPQLDLGECPSMVVSRPLKAEDAS